MATILLAWSEGKRRTRLGDTTGGVQPSVLFNARLRSNVPQASSARPTIAQLQNGVCVPANDVVDHGRQRDGAGEDVSP